MRTCARAIVIKDGNLLVMERFKMGKTYLTLPGGAVEPGETPAQAALREVAEESSITVGNARQVFLEDAGDPYGEQHIFLCEYVSGEPVLPPQSEEAFWSTPGKNTYTPKWLPLQELNNVPFVSPLLKEALLMAFQHGFPSDVYRFSSRQANRLS